MSTISIDLLDKLISSINSYDALRGIDYMYVPHEALFQATLIDPLKNDEYLLKCYRKEQSKNFNNFLNNRIKKNRQGKNYGV
jgi:hypothetical protein